MGPSRVDSGSFVFGVLVNTWICKTIESRDIIFGKLGKIERENNLILNIYKGFMLYLVQKMLKI